MQKKLMPRGDPAWRVSEHLRAAARYSALEQHNKAHRHILRARSISSAFGGMLDWLFGSNEAESGAESDDGDPGFKESNEIVGASAVVLTSPPGSDYAGRVGRVVREMEDWRLRGQFVLQLPIDGDPTRGAFKVQMERKSFSVLCSNKNCTRERNATMYVCTSCETARYCCEYCAKADIKEHKRNCERIKLGPVIQEIDRYNAREVQKSRIAAGNL
jgi:hypothetical protein